jgi:single-strand DNA-binding protein
MTDVNHVILIGRLTRDLGTDERSFGYTGNGQARANISIAVNRSRKNGDEWVEEVSYFDVTIWGKTAENLKPYLNKGKQIAVDGYLKQDRWEKDGQKFSRVTVVANNVQLLGGKDSDNSGAPTFKAANAETSAATNNAQSFENTNDFSEDIPF